MSLNGRYNTYMHFNTKQELIVVFLEVLHPFFCFIYWQKKGCKSKLALQQQWWQCYVTFTFWAWLDNCPRCCSKVRHWEFLNSPPQKGNLAQNTWGRARGYPDSRASAHSSQFKRTLPRTIILPFLPSVVEILQVRTPIVNIILLQRKKVWTFSRKSDLTRGLK